MTLCVDRLETAGKLLYGDVWQTNLARDLGIDSRLVRQWCAKERVMRYEYYQKIVQLLTERQKLIGEHLVLLESNRSQIDHCRLASDIDFLCAALNEYEEDFDPELGKPTEFLDYTNLPVFSQNIPKDTKGVVSYSDDYLLIKNKKGKWELIPRLIGE